MNTPICDFVEAYREKNALRLHMPGHKGRAVLGLEWADLTEINGADSLYEASGIIKESERNASRIFGAHTVYSTEGSSQCVRAMLCLARRYAAAHGKAPRILAARNAHKALLIGAAMLGIEITWLTPAREESYLFHTPSPRELERRLTEEDPPVAVYLTSPDYLGYRADLATVAEICHRHGALLLVDNAHGAYLKLLRPSEHPMDLGADLCCDSAHKTLPALTGAAYLHVSRSAPAELREGMKDAMALFGSTSPSYLILQSLDRLNRELTQGYGERLAVFCQRVDELKAELVRTGYLLCGNEPLKLTVSAKPYGYTGAELAERLEERGVVCEFSDPDYLVLMLTPDLGEEGLLRLSQAMRAIPRRAPVVTLPPPLPVCERVLSPREAMLSPFERLPVEQCVGRVLASPSVGCPPAVPILVSGERITREAVQCFAYYGVAECAVVKE